MMGFWSALAFLSRLPVPEEAHLAPIDQPRVAGWFGAAGLALGLLTALVAEAAMMLLGPWVGAGVAVAAGVLMTGALHEDALADVCDAFFATRDREKMLAIMKDSRIGTYGGCALILSLGVKTACLAQLGALPQPGLLAGSIVASWGLSRAWGVWLMGALKPIQSQVSLGRVYAATLTPARVAAALFTALVGGGLFMVIFSGQLGPLWLVGAGGFFTVLLLRSWFYFRLKGFTGDCIGAAVNLSEIAGLLAVLGVYGFL